MSHHVDDGPTVSLHITGRHDTEHTEVGRQAKNHHTAMLLCEKVLARYVHSSRQVGLTHVLKMTVVKTATGSAHRV